MYLQRILVFGGTSTIAQHVLRLLVGRGASVFCVGRSPRKLEAVLSDLKVRASDGQIVDGTVADLKVADRHKELYEQALATRSTTSARRLLSTSTVETGCRPGGSSSMTEQSRSA